MIRLMCRTLPGFLFCRWLLDSGKVENLRSDIQASLRRNVGWQEGVRGISYGLFSPHFKRWFIGN